MIVVTGGNGFVGSRVVAGLQAKGYDTFTPRSRNYDLRDPAAVTHLYRDVSPSVVIHLAASVGGIGANQSNPARYFYDNMAMGLNLIEQARLFGVSKFVAIGTICAYPKFTPVPFRESDLWNGYPEETNAPYGIAKKALLTMCQAYRQQYGLNAVYLMPTNLYGPRDNFDANTSHVIPALIRKCVEANEHKADHITAWGTGNATRDFLFVDDAAEAIVNAFESYDDGEPVNIGSGNEVSIKAIAETIAKLTGFAGEIRWDASRPDGQPRRCLDTSRAQAFGWQAKTSLEDGLKQTIQWYTHGSH